MVTSRALASLKVGEFAAVGADPLGLGSERLSAGDKTGAFSSEP
jgi:hypothetical protein